MYGIPLRASLIRVCYRLIWTLSGIQGRAREELVAGLHTVCSNCETAYSTLLERLGPIKEACIKEEAKGLTDQISKFVNDQETRKRFIPGSIHVEVDNLLQKLGSNLEPLKYSIRAYSTGTVKDALDRAGKDDVKLIQQYDQFCSELYELARIIAETEGDEQSRWMHYVNEVIEDAQKQLDTSVKQLNSIKDEIIDKALAPS